MSYKTRISLTKDEKAKQGVDLAVLEAKSSVNKVIADAELQIARSEGALNAQLGAEPFNLEAVIKTKSEIATYESRLEIAKEILETEFAD